MSPQLAISSVFSILAMASLCVMTLAGTGPRAVENATFAVQAEIPTVSSIAPDLLH